VETASGAPEFGAVGFSVVAVLALAGVAAVAGVVPLLVVEPGEEPGRTEALELPTVETPAAGPVPADVFELIRLSTEPVVPFTPVLFLPKVGEEYELTVAEEPVAAVEAPAPLEAFELIRLSITELPEAPLVPALFRPKLGEAPTEPRDVPTELPEEALPEPPPTACANAKLELRANSDASATVAGFMLCPFGVRAADKQQGLFDCSKTRS
jgi:hypothetical protein